MVVEAESPVFGVALPVAVERTPSHDGVKLPVVVRECIDYIEEHGESPSILTHSLHLI